MTQPQMPFSGVTPREPTQRERLMRAEVFDRYVETWPDRPVPVVTAHLPAREPVQGGGPAVITLDARALESRVDWLIQQVATLTARINTLERRLAETTREDRA